MSDKREGTETAPDSVQRIIADLETIDRKLGEPSIVQGLADPDAGAKARVFLRSVIEALAPATLPEVVEETGTAKRRVKIKAESEITAPIDGARAGSGAKSGGASKSSSRSGKSAGRRPANADKAPAGLLARLGAAAEAPPAVEPEPEPPRAAASPPAKEENSLKATADRLAQLEAEIADLTEAVTAVPTRPASPASQSRLGADQAAMPPSDSTPASLPSRTPDALNEATDDLDEDAEITIIGADGAPAAPSKSSARQTPRIFQGPLPDEEEAEVEIKGQGDSPLGRRGPDRAVSGRGGASRNASPGSRDILGKWRLFRGSN